MALKNKKNRARNRKAKQSIFQDLPETQLARRLWSENKRVESARLFGQILEKHPANVPALIDASRVMGKLFDYSRATKYLNTVKEVGSRSGRANFLAGQSYRLLKQNRQAIDCFNRSIDIDSRNMDAHLELAILHERVGNLEQARNHVEQRLHVNKQDHEALFMKAKLNRRFGESEAAKRQLLELSNHDSVFWMTRARCYFELAKLFDREENHAEAWQAATLGNDLTHQHASIQRDRREKFLPALLKLADDFDSKNLNTWSDRCQVEPSNRAALLTGLPRCGTTLLGNLLGSCKGIVTADEFPVFGQLSYPLLLGNTSPQNLSLNFFDRAPAQHLALVGNSYRSSFQSIFPSRSSKGLLIDKNPSLLPLLIPYLATFPNQQLIIAKRDPRDTIVSCFMTYMPVNDFTVDKVELEKATTRFELEWRYWHRVREVIPDRQRLEIRYERLVASTDSELARSCEFLGLEKTIDSSNYPDKVNVDSIHSPSYEEAMQPVYNQAIGRWKNYQSFLDPVMDRLNRLAETLGY